MPELPEVETVARLVRPRLVGRTIEDVDVSWPRTLGGATRPAFARAVVGARIGRVWRRAKYIVFDLERDGELDGWLVGHLRMTGRMHVEAPGWDAGPYRRASLALDDGRVFHFIDVRKFGRLVFTGDLGACFAGLGPEPLEHEFTSEVFCAALRSRRRLLKPLLLDQSFVAGLGNIYVDEALHRARLHPLARSERVPRVRAVELHAQIQAVLSEAIEREGSSFDTFYRTPEGKPGDYQHQFQVYGRDGQACHTCGREIVKLVVGQRGTHVCPGCQGRGPRRRTPARAPRRPGG